VVTPHGIRLKLRIRIHLGGAIAPYHAIVRTTQVIFDLGRGARLIARADSFEQGGM
jgi:hypothetical protein